MPGQSAAVLSAETGNTLLTLPSCCNQHGLQYKADGHGKYKPGLLIIACYLAGYQGHSPARRADRLPPSQGPAGHEPAGARG